jgi:hypothetical protein
VVEEQHLGHGAQANTARHFEREDGTYRHWAVGLSPSRSEEMRARRYRHETFMEHGRKLACASVAKCPLTGVAVSARLGSLGDGSEFARYRVANHQLLNEQIMKNQSKRP